MMDFASVWWYFSSLCAALFLFSTGVYLIPILYLTYFAGTQDLRRKYCAHAPWAVVTGASSGIGKALARRLASQGINVVLVALEDDLLTRTHRELEQEFTMIQLRSVGVDLSQNAEVYMKKLKDCTNDIRVGVVFSNAGYVLMSYFEERDIEQHIRNVECNSMAAVRITHWFYSRMKEQGIKGCIAFTSSAVLFMPAPFAVMYGASKAMLTQFGQSLAVEGASLGIDITVFHPSYTHSNFYAKTPKLGVLKVLAKFGWSADNVAEVMFKSVGRVVVRDFGMYAICTNMIGRLFDGGFLASTSIPFAESAAPPGTIVGGKRKK